MPCRHLFAKICKGRPSQSAITSGPVDESGDAVVLHWLPGSNDDTMSGAAKVDQVASTRVPCESESESEQKTVSGKNESTRFLEREQLILRIEALEAENKVRMCGCGMRWCIRIFPKRAIVIAGLSMKTHYCAVFSDFDGRLPLLRGGFQDEMCRQKAALLLMRQSTCALNHNQGHAQM